MWNVVNLHHLLQTTWSKHWFTSVIQPKRWSLFIDYTDRGLYLSFWWLWFQQMTQSSAFWLDSKEKGPKWERIKAEHDFIATCVFFMCFSTHLWSFWGRKRFCIYTNLRWMFNLSKLPSNVWCHFLLKCEWCWMWAGHRSVPNQLFLMCHICFISLWLPFLFKCSLDHSLNVVASMCIKSGCNDYCLNMLIYCYYYSHYNYQ